jgi:hypothetical protein
MDVVWMAQFKSFKILNNHGQGTVEYILLLAVVISISYVVFNSKAFKSFAAGDTGMFSTVKKGMVYSYRYGREYNSSEDFDAAMVFEYTSNQHDLYFNKKENGTHFFSGTGKYPAN